jgi:hypothetical protein
VPLWHDPAMRLQPAAIGALVVACLSGCVFPRGHTPVSPAPRHVEHASAPKHLYQLVLVEAEVPAKMRSGLPWDDTPEDALADPYLELAVQGRVLWRSSTQRNTTTTRWKDPPAENLRIDTGDMVDLALWDDDPVARDPIGIYQGRAFAHAMLGEEFTIQLEGGTRIVLRLDPPVPVVGLGLASYELHNDAIWVRAVLPTSPAARAGLAPGDRIYMLDGVTVRKLGPRNAEARLAVASDATLKLGVKRGEAWRDLHLSAGPIWLGKPE